MGAQTTLVEPLGEIPGPEHRVAAAQVVQAAEPAQAGESKIPTQIRVKETRR